MSTPLKINPRTPVGTPVRTPARTPNGKNSGTPVGTPNERNSNRQLTNNQKRNIYLNTKDHNLRNAINILRYNSNNNNNTFNEFKNNFNNMSFDSRKDNVNPNNALFMDKTNKKVYKIGLWDNCSMGIGNEYIAYKKIDKKANNHKYVHTPRMIDCKIIPGTKYALLVITYQSALENAILITNTSDHLYMEAENFLNNLGIVHEDLLGNIYEIHITNHKKFFIIDFEDCKFNKNKNFNLNNTSKEKLKNMDNKVKKLNSQQQTCVKKRKPGLGLFPNTSPITPISPFSLGPTTPNNNNNNNNNNPYPYNRFVNNSSHGSPLKSPRRGGKKNKSKKK